MPKSAKSAVHGCHHGFCKSAAQQPRTCEVATGCLRDEVLLSLALPHKDVAIACVDSGRASNGQHSEVSSGFAVSGSG